MKNADCHFPRQPAFSFFIHSVIGVLAPVKLDLHNQIRCLLDRYRYALLRQFGILPFSALPFLIRFDRHRNCKNLIINLHKSFRALILFGVALQLFLAQTLEVLRTAIAHKKVSRHNIIDAIVFIPQGAEVPAACLPHCRPDTQFLQTDRPPEYNR